MAERFAYDIVADLRRWSKDDLDFTVLTEAADKLDELVTLLANAETARDQAQATAAVRAGQIQQLRDHSSADLALIAELRGQIVALTGANNDLRAAVARAEQATAEALRKRLADHYLADIVCDHDRAQDNPICACSRVHLGWHPSVGAAVAAWVDHVLAADVPAAADEDARVRDWYNAIPTSGDEPTVEEHHPERICARCGGPNIPWTAPSPLWNQVMRGGDINGTEIHDGVVCPTCFATLAQERGVADLWRLSAQRVHVPLQTVTPSGRVWDAEKWLWVDPPQPDGALSVECPTCGSGPGQPCIHQPTGDIRLPWHEARYRAADAPAIEATLGQPTNTTSTPKAGSAAAGEAL